MLIAIVPLLLHANITYTLLNPETILAEFAFSGRLMYNGFFDTVVYNNYAVSRAPAARGGLLQLQLRHSISDT